jgi:hypothetical protein
MMGGRGRQGGGRAPTIVAPSNNSAVSPNAMNPAGGAMGGGFGMRGLS